MCNLIASTSTSPVDDELSPEMDVLSCHGPSSVSFFFPFVALWGLRPVSFLAVCGLGRLWFGMSVCVQSSLTCDPGWWCHWAAMLMCKYCGKAVIKEAHWWAPVCFWE